MSRTNANTILFACNFLSKGWEISILGFLAFIQDRHHLPIIMIGILSSVFLIAQISISFIAGRIAHAVHARNVVLFSIGASACAWLILSLAGLFGSHLLSLLFLAYMLGGVSSGLFEPIGNSMVAKLASASNRSTAIGNFAAFGDMGRIALGAIATALAGIKFIGLGYTCALMCLSGIAALLLVQRAISRSVADDQAVVEQEPVHLGDLLRNQRFCYATMAGIADSFSSASLYIFIPLLLTAKGIALSNTGYFNVVFFAGYMSGRVVLGRLADKHGAPRMLMAAKCLMALLVLLLTLVHGALTFAVLMFLLGVFTRGSSPIIRAMVADSMDEKVSFHNAFSAFSTLSRGSSAASRPLYGLLAAWSVPAVFYASALVSLATLYPAARYPDEPVASEQCSRLAEAIVAGNELEPEEERARS